MASSAEGIVQIVLVLLFMIAAPIAFGVLSGRWARKRTYQNLHPDSMNDGTSGDLVMDYPKKAALYASVPLAMVCAVSLVALLWAVAVPSADSTALSAVLYGVLFGLSMSGTLWTTAAHRNVEFVLNSQGVAKRRPEKKAFFIGWDEVKELRVSTIFRDSFVLVTPNGPRRIPSFLNGMKDLASMLAVKVPQERWGVGVERSIEKYVKGYY